MSFDLYFCPQNGPAPTTAELKEYFSALPGFEVSDIPAGGVDFIYQNEATGVYCIFSYSELDARELEGCGSSGLSFNLNYYRPSFFAYETMPLVESFCKNFDLVVEDPQEETVQGAEASRLISSWQSHNTWAMGAMSKTAAEEKLELHYLPEVSATEWWRYMRIRQDIEDGLTRDIFVPSLMFLMSPAKALFRLMLWPEGIAQFFPPADQVYVRREKKGIFRTKLEEGLVSYESVMSTVSSLLDDYDFRGYRIKYLSPEKTSSARQLIQTLNLEPVDLKQYRRMAPDSFHDVAVPS